MAAERAMGPDWPDFQHLLTPSATFHRDGLPTPLSPSCTSYDDRYFLAYPVKTKPRWYHQIPYFVLVISLVEILTYCLFQDYVYDSLKFNEKFRWQVWRYVSYMLLHADNWHLVINIWVQLMFGVVLERSQGSLRICAVYVLGGTAGALTAYIFQFNLSIVGASAGVYALIISYTADIIYNYTRKHNLVKVIFVICFILFDIIFNCYHAFQSKSDNASPTISWSAHLGGALAGLLIGFVVYEGEYRKEHWARVVFYSSVILGILYFTTIIVLNAMCIHVPLNI